MIAGLLLAGAGSVWLVAHLLLPRLLEPPRGDGPGGWVPGFDPVAPPVVYPPPVAAVTGRPDAATAFLPAVIG